MAIQPLFDFTFWCSRSSLSLASISFLTTFSAYKYLIENYGVKKNAIWNLNAQLLTKWNKLYKHQLKRNRCRTCKARVQHCSEDYLNNIISYFSWTIIQFNTWLYIICQLQYVEYASYCCHEDFCFKYIFKELEWVENL